MPTVAEIEAMDRAAMASWHLRVAKALGNDYLLSRARPKPNDTD